MPQALIDATSDLRAGPITKGEYGRCIARRAAYTLRQKEGADRNGTTRWTCGAGTNAPIVRCDGKPASLPARVTRQPDGSRGDNRETVDLSLLRTRPPEGQLPDVCRQSSINVKATDLQQLLQTLIFGTPEQTAHYRAMRNGQEGYHGFAKDTAHEAIGEPGLRRKRGTAAQTLYAAIGLLVANLRKIATFLDHASDDDGQLSVPRAPRDAFQTEDPLGSNGGYWDSKMNQAPAPISRTRHQTSARQPRRTPHHRLGSATPTHLHETARPALRRP